MSLGILYRGCVAGEVQDSGGQEGKEQMQKHTMPTFCHSAALPPAGCVSPVSLSLLGFSTSLPTPGGHSGLPSTPFDCFLNTFPAPLLLVFRHPLCIPVISSVRFEHIENILSYSILCP